MNPRLAAIPGSMIRALNSRKKPGDIDFGLGEPVLCPDREILDAAVDWSVAHGCKYGPNAGLEDVRQTIADYYLRPGLDAPQAVCITNGSQEAIFLAITTVCDPSEHEILVVEPAYPLYHKVAAMQGVASRAVQMSAARGFEIDAEAILAAVRPATRLIVLCSPSNPTGRIASDDALTRLAEGLLQLPDPPYILLDEAYRELHYSPGPPADLAPRYPRSLIAGSLSKSNALTGLRVGWLLAPPEVMPLALKVHQFVLTSANIIGQRVAFEIFSRRLLGAHRAHYRAQWQAFETLLRAAKLRHVPPEGGFYAMLGLPDGTDDVQAAHRLVDEFGVVMIPGSAFGEAARGWLRASFVSPPDLLAEGLERYRTYLAAAV